MKPSFRPSFGLRLAPLAWASLATTASLALAAPSISAAEEPLQVVVFETSAAAPPVSRVVGPVSAHACQPVEQDSRTAVIDHLRHKASSMGATGVVDVQLQVEKSQTLYIKNGFPNPCRFETTASGTAVVLAAQPAPLHVTRASDPN